MLVGYCEKKLLIIIIDTDVDDVCYCEKWLLIIIIDNDVDDVCYCENKIVDYFY